MSIDPGIELGLTVLGLGLGLGLGPASGLGLGLGLELELGLGLGAFLQATQHHKLGAAWCIICRCVHHATDAHHVLRGSLWLESGLAELRVRVGFGVILRFVITKIIP